MTLAAMAMLAAELPREIHIGTPNFFRQGREYKYIFDDRIDCYVCSHQTTTGVPGEILAIMIADEPDGSVWYVAAEGTLQDAPDGRHRFQARQGVFRTQDSFWQVGNHEWQLNPNSSATNTQTAWDEDDSMTAWTLRPSRFAAGSQLALASS